MKSEFEILNKALAPFREALISHPIYAQLQSKKGIQLFMEQHVFAVWDFMSLLKSLQRGMTCVEVPWVPVGTASSRRLINEIVWGEESDIGEDGQASSHFELYRQSMIQIGASTEKIDAFIEQLKAKTPLEKAIDSLDVNLETKNFMKFTFSAIETGKLHVIAAVFTFGREDLIPDMFIEIVNELSNKNEVQASQLVYYLNRHIEVDGGEHGPMSLQMIEDLCGNDTKKWEEAVTYSRTAMAMRIQLWDGILRSLN